MEILESSEMKRDKEWLKNEIEIMGSETSENYPHEQMVDRELVLNLIDQLDEPEKPIIPQFVADTIDEFTGYELGDRPGENSVFNFIDNLKGDFGNGYHKKTKEWYRESLQNQIDIERAWLDGYEVEKEKLYYVIDKSKRPILTIHEGKVIASASVSKVKRAEKLSTPDYKYRLTERQIKDYDPRFMAFAEEVSE